jgi:K+-sensing histidine kinase KdpD
MASNRNLLVLPGDGIRPEVMNEVRKIIAWMGKKRAIGFDIKEDLVGGAALDKHGVPLSDDAMKNALEALDRGGDIHVKLSSDDEWVVLSIRDTGVGIPVDKLTRVFDAYYTTKASGGGIGMLILLRILRAHGGTVDIQSTPDVGTTVILRFPLKHRRVRTLEAPKA